MKKYKCLRKLDQKLGARALQGKSIKFKYLIKSVLVQKW